MRGVHSFLSVCASLTLPFSLAHTQSFHLHIKYFMAKVWTILVCIFLSVRPGELISTWYIFIIVFVYERISAHAHKNVISGLLFYFIFCLFQSCLRQRHLFHCHLFLKSNLVMGSMRCHSLFTEQHLCHCQRHQITKTTNEVYKNWFNYLDLIRVESSFWQHVEYGKVQSSWENPVTSWRWAVCVWARDGITDEKE